MFIHSLATYSSEHWIGPLCLESSLNCWWYKFNKTASNIIHIFCPIKTLSQNVIIFQGYPIGIKFGTGLSTVNSLPCSRKEVISALCHGALLSCRRWVHCGHKNMDMVSNNNPYLFLIDLPG